jgi:hypothetical protein
MDSHVMFMILLMVALKAVLNRERLLKISRKSGSVPTVGWEMNFFKMGIGACKWNRTGQNKYVASAQTGKAGERGRMAKAMSDLQSGGSALMEDATNG